MKIINCPVCGNRISSDSISCPECDFEIFQYMNPKVTKRKHNFGLYCLAFFITLILIFIIIGFKSQLTSMQKQEASSDDIPENCNGTSTPIILEDEDLSSDFQLSNESNSVSGVYSGDDHEILAICDNGLAYYYCATPEFVELACPWNFNGSQLNIELSKLHCVITANISDNDFSELIFKSNSVNWNTEVFSRLNLDPYDYIKRNVESNDPLVQVNSNGSFSFSIEDINFTVPKQYRDLEDDFDDMKNCFVFVDTDAQTDYTSSIMFYSEKKLFPDLSFDKHSYDTLYNFCSRFIDDVEIGEVSTTDIAEKVSYRSTIHGFLNSGFSGLSGYQIDGNIICIPKENSCLYILMIQSSDRQLNSNDLYDEILNSAY